MRTNIIILLAVIALSACSRTPLGVIGQHGTEQGDQDTSATTSVATSSATSTKTTVFTADDTSTLTKTATTTATGTPIATATPTDTFTATTTSSGTGTTLQEQCEKNGGYWTPENVCRDKVNPSSTQTATTTAVSMVAVIASVDVQKIDAQGKPAEDTRRFVIGFNGPAVDIRLKVTESLSGAVITDTPVIANGSKDEPVAVNLDRKLKSATAYEYLVSAKSPDSAFVQSFTGEFKTANCFIGETRHCYNGIPASTEGVGKCHGATNACVMTGNGPQWDPSCAENTPYPYGDIMDNGVDDDCNGIVDDGAYFCPVNDSTISQGCCMPKGSSFPRPSLSDLTHQPNAYTLVKGSNSFVYLYASDGKRYVFTSKDVIKSWFTNFDGGVLGELVNVCNTVNELSDVELASIPMGGNVTIRPGSYIVKIASDPKLYVVAKGKVLRWLSNPDLAEKLYPGTSAQRIRIVSDAFFTNYFMGLEVKNASDYDPKAEWTAANMESEAATKQ